jgi:DNA invertase Pin-like site-specific DNA recombinase
MRVPAVRDGTSFALDLGVDFSTAAETAMAQMTAVFAERERRLIGERTRAALAVKKAQGVRLCRPPVLGARVRQSIRRERTAGRSYRMIAERLNAKGVPTAHGGRSWHASTVRAIVIGGVAAPGLGKSSER